MKNLLLIFVIVAAWYGYQHYVKRTTDSIATSAPIEQTLPVTTSPTVEDTEKTSNHNFKCDGRTHCSQMTSCEEATFFLQNCPDTKMDGNHDGIPCEKQWCN